MSLFIDISQCGNTCSKVGVIESLHLTIGVWLNFIIQVSSERITLTSRNTQSDLQIALVETTSTTMLGMLWHLLVLSVIASWPLRCWLGDTR